MSGDASVQSVFPQLRMTDEARSLAFYVDGLGFAVDWTHRHAPGLPLFAQLTRAGQAILLSAHADDCAPGGAVYFKVADVDDVAVAFRAAGLEDLHGPEDTPWGTRQLFVVDPDGNRLCFATHPEEG